MHTTRRVLKFKLLPTVNTHRLPRSISTIASTPSLLLASRRPVNDPRTYLVKLMSSPSNPIGATATTSATELLETATAKPAPVFDFPVSPVPENPLGQGKYIKTAAALIIGDEILNGKTLDRNSNYFARYCFERGIDLKRIEVIADDEDEIIEASRRLVKNYDLVVSSGGIGPTHDDITYASLAKAFNQPLVHHEETLSRMTEMFRHRPWVSSQTADQKTATQRMALFPADAEVLFIGKDMWVPVIRLEHKLCVLPGIPTLFQRLLDNLTPYLPLPPSEERPIRMQVFTKRAESMIAPYLTSLQARAKQYGISVGSYPVLRTTNPPASPSAASANPSTSNSQHVNSTSSSNVVSPGGVYVSLIGPGSYSSQLHTFAAEVETEVEGSIVSEEEVVRQKGGEWFVESTGMKVASTTQDLSGETIDQKGKL